MRRQKRVYSWDVHARIDEKIPESIRLAMAHQGWNAFGVFELVEEELKAEKKRLKEQPCSRT